jgi:hypothetical protein
MAEKIQYQGAVMAVLKDELGRDWTVQVPIALTGPRELDQERAKPLAEKACMKALTMAGDEARAYAINNRRPVDISEQLANLETGKGGNPDGS